MEYVIEVEELWKEFGRIVAVAGISFSVLSGECFGLLGPNGAGKTSTIRMIYGFSPITRGSLKVFGLDIQRHWRTIRSHIGVCQQDNTLDPDLTVLQNLEVFARYFNIPRKTAKERADALLDFIALGQRAQSKVSELSGGLMRRLVLARALINNPELLILDEPSTGLDPQSRHQVWEKVENLRARGLTIVLTTHYMEEASRLCDRLIIMDHGKILVQGKPAELIQSYAGRDVIEVTAPSRELREYVLSKDLRVDDLDHRIIIYGEQNDEIFDAVRTKYCDENCSLRMATLEDVFLRLTGRDLRE